MSARPDRHAAAVWGHLMKFFSALGWILILVFAVTWWNNRGSDTATDTRCGDPDLAYVVGQRAVRRELLNPDGARFPRPSSSTNDVSITEIAPCTYRVRAWVDAQNAFGATLRRRFSLDMKYNPDSKTWTPSNLSIN